MPQRRMLNTVNSIEGIPAAKPRTTIPHEFVLDALSRLSPWTRPMFGCVAVYVGEKIVLILRQKSTFERDNGVWLATTEEHHASLREEVPNMRSIGILGKEITGWQVLPVDAPDFEESALRVCELVVAGDFRVGKIPGKRRRPATRPIAGAKRKAGRRPKE